jgi:hypothetical protein
MTGDPAAVISDYSVFNDAQLTSFVQEALENNRSLRAAIESVRQSELALQSTRSGLFPQISGSLGARTAAPTDDLGSNTDSYSFALNGRYDVDIMGDLNASIQAAGAGLRSTEAVYEQTRRQIAAQVARAYFAVIEGQLQLDLGKAGGEDGHQRHDLAHAEAVDAHEPRARDVVVVLQHPRAGGAVGLEVQPTIAAGFVGARLELAGERDAAVREAMRPAAGRLDLAPVKGGRRAVVRRGVVDPAVGAVQLAGGGELRADALVVGAPGEAAGTHRRGEDRLAGLGRDVRAGALRAQACGRHRSSSFSRSVSSPRSALIRSANQATPLSRRDSGPGVNSVFASPSCIRPTSSSSSWVVIWLM